MTEHIVAAAVSDGKMVFSMQRPMRHGDVLESMLVEFGLDAMEIGYPDNQGFLTSEGRFVERYEAGKIACAAGQIESLKWPPLLYSEDLW